jgi:hypothetical protein
MDTGPNEPASPEPPSEEYPWPDSTVACPTPYSLEGSRVQGRAWGVRPGALGLRVRVQGSGLRVSGLGMRFEGSGFRGPGSGFRVQGLGFEI